MVDPVQIAERICGNKITAPDECGIASARVHRPKLVKGEGDIVTAARIVKTIGELCSTARSRPGVRHPKGKDPGIFDLEENIAKKIAAALKVSANPGEVLVRSRTGNTDAYLDFLRAKVAERGRLPMRQCSWSRC
jgi:hypothetical protein